MVAIETSLDRNSPVPLYFQIAQQMQAMIESGKLQTGTRLQNEIELSERLGVSRPTMRRAIDMLVEEGLLVRRRGVGTVIVPRRVRRPLALSSLYDDLAEGGRRPRTQVLSVERAPADHEAATALGIPPGEEVVSVKRLRFADDQPIALMHNQLPPGIAALTTEGLSEHGLYELLRRAGITLASAQQSISARQASLAEARLLAVRRGAVLLTMTRVAYDRMGRPVEFGSHCYPAERYSFEMSLISR